MKKTLLLAAVLLAFGSGIAYGDDDTIAITQTCVRNNCVMLIGPPGGGLGKIITVPESFDPDQPARIVKWEDFCQPKIVLDSFGVRRYTFVQAGCEYGRDQ